MKIANPKFVDPIAAYVAANKTAIQTWINNRPTDARYITADEIRAAFPAQAAFLTDGTIAEICKALGLTVE
jgi:hypothetical protein